MKRLAGDDAALKKHAHAFITLNSIDTLKDMRGFLGRTVCCDQIFCRAEGWDVFGLI